MENSSQLLRGVLDMCLLALLAQRSCYGYEIVRQLEVRGLSLVAEGSVYPALSRLERAGLIEGHWAASAGGPRRKYYRVGRAGREQLAQWSQHWEEFRDAVDGIVKGANHAGTR